MNTKIALVQFWVEIHKDFLYTKRKVEKYLIKASQEKCNIICFPEDFWFGSFDYYTSEEIENIVLIQTPKILKWFQQKAVKYRLNIIAGTFIEKEQDNFFNISSIINKNGKIIYKYKKQNLVPFGFEKKYLSIGNNNRVFDIDGVRIGVIICRDLFYPELVKNLRLQGAEIIIIPAFWSKRSSDYKRHQLLYKYNFLTEHKIVDSLCRARSYENEVAILFVNASGNLKNDNEFDVLLGRTQICLPLYSCINKLSLNKEELLIFEYNRNIITDARKIYQLFIE